MAKAILAVSKKVIVLSFNGLWTLLRKSSVVIPVPNKSKPTVLNDYRHVALTAIIMKCFERIVMELLVSQTKPFTDPF